MFALRPTRTRRTLRRPAQKSDTYPQHTRRWANVRRLRGQCPVSVSNAPTTSPPLQLGLRCNKNMHFIFSKMLNPHLSSSVEERETQIPLHFFNPCSNVLTTKCTTLCTCVSILLQIFLRVKSAH